MLNVCLSWSAMRRRPRGEKEGTAEREEEEELAPSYLSSQS
jgi:hypothetical protein